VGRLVILSGPSCAGKGPLFSALQRLHPDLAGRLKKVVLYNSRAPRPGERDGVDYHFRPRAEIEAMRGDGRFSVMEVRGDVQALELDGLRSDLESGDALFEGNPFVGCTLMEAEAAVKGGLSTLFLSPLSREEVEYLGAPHRGVSLPDFVADVMRRKLLRRTARQRGMLSLKDLEDVERRSGSAYAELKLAHRFQHVIPNHDGEDSENWDAFYYPLGDARRALAAFVGVLQGSAPSWVESWDEDLLP
jgi:guanylate kinase